MRRHWFAEPLESRALLSALVAEYSADQVDVVELRPSDEASSRNLERHELPLPVLQELETRFPGAIWESAEFDPSSESPYDVRVNWRGMNLEVALSSAG